MKQAHRRTWRDRIPWGLFVEGACVLWMWAMVIAFFFYVLPLIAAGRGV